MIFRLVVLLFCASTLFAEKAYFFLSWKAEKFVKNPKVMSQECPHICKVFDDCGVLLEPLDKSRYFPQHKIPKGLIPRLFSWFNHEKVKDADHYIFWNLDHELKKVNFSHFDKEKLVLFVFEPRTVEPELYRREYTDYFGKIFTFDDDLVDGKKYFKFHYPSLKEPIDEIIPFKKKKLCTLVSSRLSSAHPGQLYVERENAIKFFEDKEKEFDLFGRYWEKRKYKNYHGTIGDKISVIKHYKFYICYENTRDQRGYITEKIFDCFHAKVVPIYWGAPNIEEYIPKNCYIDRRDFKTMDELYHFMKNMDEKTYQGYLDAADAFTKSEKAKVFTMEYIAKSCFPIILNKAPPRIEKAS